MVQAIIIGKVEKEQLPAAPWEDESKIINKIDESLVRLSESLPITLKNEILLGTLRDSRLKIVIPIKVDFLNEKDKIIAEAEEINEFGFGDNRSEALVDLQRAIRELYFTLEKEHRKLGTDLQHVWEVLQKKILKR
jgi:hypothetical protein